MSGSMYVVFNKNFNIQSIGRSNREIGYKELKQISVSLIISMNDKIK